MTGCSLFVRGTARNGHDAREHVRASQYMGGVHVLIGTEVCHHPGQSTGWFTRPFCLPQASCSLRTRARRQRWRRQRARGRLRRRAARGRRRRRAGCRPAVVDRSTEAPVALSTPTAPFFWGGPGAPPSRGICSIDGGEGRRLYFKQPHLGLMRALHRHFVATMCKHRWPVTRPSRDRAAEAPGRNARSGRQRSQGRKGRSFQQAAA